MQKGAVRLPRILVLIICYLAQVSARVTAGGKVVGCLNDAGCSCAATPCDLALTTSDPNNGTYIVRYSSTKAAMYAIALKLNGAATKGSPLSVPVVANALHIANSTFQLSGSSDPTAALQVSTTRVLISLWDSLMFGRVPGYPPEH